MKPSIVTLALIIAVFLAIIAVPASAPVKSGPPLPHKLVKDWPQLPADWNFGECSGVAVDAHDNVWVFNRGPHPVIQFDKDGKMLRSWTEVPVTSAHGIRVDADGNIWAADVAGHTIFKFNPAGRILMVFGNPNKQPGNNDSVHAFNRPTGIAFAPNQDVYIADGYGNSRIVKLSKDGEYLRQWGTKGSGDGQFDLVHDVTVDSGGRVYVCDRTNSRLQIFDGDGKFLGKWTDIGQPWGITYSLRENALFMCDGQNERVVKLSLDGQVLGVLGGPGKGPGKFHFAHNIAIDSTGAIYVAEIRNWRVQKFAP